MKTVNHNTTVGTQITAVNKIIPEEDTIERKILLIEDDSHVRATEKLLLESLGFSVDSATTADSAKKLLEQRAGQYTAVFLDLHIPENNDSASKPKPNAQASKGVYEALRRHNSKIILCTGIEPSEGYQKGDAWDRHLEEIISQGEVKLLTKPFGYSEILDIFQLSEKDILPQFAIARPTFVMCVSRDREFRTQLKMKSEQHGFYITILETIETLVKELKERPYDAIAIDATIYLNKNKTNENKNKTRQFENILKKVQHCVPGISTIILKKEENSYGLENATITITSETIKERLDELIFALHNPKAYSRRRKWNELLPAETKRMGSGTVYLIAGPSSGGKTSSVEGAIHRLKEQGIPAQLIKKITTREPRADDSDSAQFEFISPEKFETEYGGCAADINNIVQYTAFGRKYAIDIKRTLAQTRTNGGVSFIISSAEANDIQKILSAFKKFETDVIPVLMYSPPNILQERRNNSNRPENEKKDRSDEVLQQQASDYWNRRASFWHTIITAQNPKEQEIDGPLDGSAENKMIEIGQTSDMLTSIVWWDAVLRKEKDIVKTLTSECEPKNREKYMRTYVDFLVERLFTFATPANIQGIKTLVDSFERTLTLSGRKQEIYLRCDTALLRTLAEEEHLSPDIVRTLLFSNALKVYDVSLAYGRLNVFLGKPDFMTKRDERGVRQFMFKMLEHTIGYHAIGRNISDVAFETESSFGLVKSKGEHINDGLFYSLTQAEELVKNKLPYALHIGFATKLPPLKKNILPINPEIIEELLHSKDERYYRLREHTIDEKLMK